MEKVDSWNLIQLDHEHKTVFLILSHRYNPQCSGCRHDLNEAKGIAKERGYQFVLKEPEIDRPFVSGFRLSKNGKQIDPLD